MYGSCGTVLGDDVESSPQSRSYSQQNIVSRSRTEMPTLVFHDLGLSIISNLNMDANSVPISSDQVSNFKRHWNRIACKKRSFDRNLKNAFSILNSIKNKLSINDALIEKSFYIYGKVLEKRISSLHNLCKYV